jgi:hypothetical protein
MAVPRTKNLSFVGGAPGRRKRASDQNPASISATPRRPSTCGYVAGEVQSDQATGPGHPAQLPGLPLVSTPIGQKSDRIHRCANSGINTIADWAGKKFGYKGTVPVEFLAIAKANGLNPSRVNQVRVGFDPRVLSEGQVDILAVFVSNEPGQLDRIGYPTKLFDPRTGSPPPTYITTPDGRRDLTWLRALRKQRSGIENDVNHRGARYRHEVRAAGEPRPAVHAETSGARKSDSALVRRPGHNGGLNDT